MHSKQPGTASGQPRTQSAWNHCCGLAESQGSSQPHLDQAVGVVGAWMTLAWAGKDGAVPEHLVRGQRVRFIAHRELVQSLHFAETHKLGVTYLRWLSWEQEKEGKDARLLATVIITTATPSLIPVCCSQHQAKWFTSTAAFSLQNSPGGEVLAWFSLYRWENRRLERSSSLPKLYQLACGEDVCEVNLSSEPGFQALNHQSLCRGEVCFFACVHDERSGTVPCSLLNR